MAKIDKFFNKTIQHSITQLNKKQQQIIKNAGRIVAKQENINATIKNARKDMKHIIDSSRSIHERKAQHANVSTRFQVSQKNTHANTANNILNNVNKATTKEQLLNIKRELNTTKLSMLPKHIKEPIERKIIYKLEMLSNQTSKTQHINDIIKQKEASYKSNKYVNNFLQSIAKCNTNEELSALYSQLGKTSVTLINQEEKNFITDKIKKHSYRSNTNVTNFLKKIDNIETKEGLLELNKEIKTTSYTIRTKSFLSKLIIDKIVMISDMNTKSNN